MFFLGGGLRRNFILLSVLIGCCVGFVKIGHTEPLFKIVETSCKKACIEGKGDQAFCASYCQCVRGRVEKLAQRSNITKALQGRQKQEAMIHHCSGVTAIKFFSKSCVSQCNGAPNCDDYCACLEDKISNKRKFSEIGAFFIKLGKNEIDAMNKLKRFETFCTK